ncbi:MAG: hypothetical protein JXR56_00520 [Candidatus Cloacimonetes bacterium]|nr:hypothetical protein [Candidatus Cloacimonadota bacterium]
MKLLLMLVLIVGSTILFAVKPLPKSLFGEWRGEELRSFVKTVASANQTVDISLSINPDGTVEGTVGDAVLKNCRVKRNRGQLGRMLNFKTDYIIFGGTIEGAVMIGDKVTKRHFTLPFNLDRDNITGSVMVIYKAKYPDPLITVKLKKHQI